MRIFKARLAHNATDYRDFAIGIFAFSISFFRLLPFFRKFSFFCRLFFALSTLFIFFSVYFPAVHLLGSSPWIVTFSSSSSHETVTFVCLFCECIPHPLASLIHSFQTFMLIQPQIHLSLRTNQPPAFCRPQHNRRSRSSLCLHFVHLPPLFCLSFDLLPSSLTYRTTRSSLKYIPIHTLHSL